MGKTYKNKYERVIIFKPDKTGKIKKKLKLKFRQCRFFGIEIEKSFYFHKNFAFFKE